MPNFKDIGSGHSYDLDCRSFLRTGIASAATLTGGLSIPRIARAAGVTSTKPLVKVDASSARSRSPASVSASRI